MDELLLKSFWKKKCSLFHVLQEKQLLEEKLKELQSLLEEKDKGEELLRKQLQEKEEQRLQDLVSCKEISK